MHLISPLAAGVNGCGSGTAEIYQRGSVTRADYYLGNDGFEGTGLVSSGADVTLDANGGAQVYVNELVTVVCKDSDGTEVRRFVAGVASTAVEIDSTSFTGTPYAGGASAVSEPTTLAAILDKWILSAGSEDWKVSIDGVDTNLSSAVTSGGLSGILYNVKNSAYGAVGDGVTDDRSAIAAAITAAASSGGVVFFPPGTYRMTSGITLPYNVALLGSGSLLSILAPEHATADAITVTGNASAVRYTPILNLSILPSGAHAGDLIQTDTALLHLLIDGCTLGNSNADGGLVLASDTPAAGSVTIRNSRFVPGGATSTRVLRLDDTPAFVSGCTFVMHGGPGIQGEDLSVDNCLFDNSAVSGGASVSVAPACIGSVGTGGLRFRVSNCRFTAPSTNIVVGIRIYGTATPVHSGSFIRESNNIFEGTAGSTPRCAPYDSNVTSASKGCQVYLGSRRGRRYEVTDNSATVVLSQMALEHETVVVKRSTSTDQTVLLADSSAYNDIPPDGNDVVVMVWNESGGNITAETFSLRGAGAAVGITNNESALVHARYAQLESDCGAYATAPVVATGDPY